MAEWNITVQGLGAVRQQFVVASTQLLPTVSAAMARRLQSAVAYAKERYLSGGTTSDRLAVRSGALRQAFGAEVLTSGTEVVGRIGYIYGAPVYAAIHEGWPDGRASTTIRPRHGQYLAIPLTDAARRTPPRSVPNTFVQYSRRGSLLIFQRTGRNTIEPLYLLKTEVVVPARPALRPTMERFLPLILDDIRHAVTWTLKGA